MIQEAQGTTPEAQAPTAPVPGTPEYRDYMIAQYDAQFPQGASEATLKQPAPAEPAAPETAPVTETPEAPKDPEAPEAPEAPKDPEAPEDNADKTPPTLGELLGRDDFFNALAADKIDDGLVKELKALGAGDEQLAAINQRLKGLLALETKVRTEALQAVAGGKAQFDAVAQWAQKNLTPQQFEFYGKEMDGPNGADVVALLQQKMNATRDPKLHTVSANAGSPVARFTSQAQVTAAMSDPRYASDPSYRAQVYERLRVSNGYA